jgi:lipid A 3-O-deacylase
MTHPNPFITFSIQTAALLLAVCALFVILLPTAQAADAPTSSPHNRYFTLTVENDLFGGGTDRHYTNGIRLGWFDAREKPPGVAKNLNDILPFFDINDTTSVAYSLGHNLYTPKAVTSPIQDPKDRPWAAFLYGSMGMVTAAQRHVDHYEVTLGIVGPLALGEPVQKTWHKLIDSTQPGGWHNQIRNEPGLILSMERQWPETLTLPIGATFLSFTPHAGFSAGNIYTYANAGATIRYSPLSNRYTDKPPGVRPAVPGTGYFSRGSDMNWEIFAGLDTRAVARNIFLDGNSFADSYRVDKKPLVADASLGLAFTWENTRLSYNLVRRSKEFYGQQSGDVFGGISLGYNF